MVAVNSSVFKFAEIKRVLLLLEKKDRLKLFLVLIVNTFLAFLDLFGVALIGITSAILIRGLQGLTAGDQVSPESKLLVTIRLRVFNFVVIFKEIYFNKSCVFSGNGSRATHGRKRNSYGYRGFC